jgi:hypothetical protein
MLPHQSSHSRIDSAKEHLFARAAPLELHARSIRVVIAVEGKDGDARRWYGEWRRTRKAASHDSDNPAAPRWSSLFQCRRTSAVGDRKPTPLMVESRQSRQEMRAVAVADNHGIG